MKKLFAGLLLCYSLSVQAETQLLDYIVAVVNDEVITSVALQDEVRTTEAKLTEQKIQAPSRQELERQVLESLIMGKIQLQFAARTGINVDDNALNETMRKVAAQNNLDLQKMRTVLEQEGLGFNQFREDIRNRMIIQRLQQRQVINKINVSPREIDAFLMAQAKQDTSKSATEFRIFHILIAVPEAASPEAIATKQKRAEEILAQLQAGADFQKTAVAMSDSPQALEGGDLGWRRLGEIPNIFADALSQLQTGEVSNLIRNSSGFHIIKLVDKRGQSAQNIVTQSRARHILIKTSEVVSDFEAQARLEGIKERIERGEKFADLAKAYSEDYSSASNGGELDWINPGDMVPEFEQMVTRLPTDKISEPFKTAFGWHIVEVLERRQQDNTEQASRMKATEQIRQRKIGEELQTWLRQLRDEAYVEYRLADGVAEKS
ncbi:peptidylprolyl isomerase [Beggiatoa leptomitoformis]|uniref:Chaperone SurA n=1 Tax=Beggiatoa leptomitoformis TaxID=288004 RepID=A0A2N9YC59_9GAMM|nr:peptidylprolyl isomerase [Beggiatoa leptomitoformis]ALG69273.2 molecular chaperone SurA [Beggiatoa leptomitoformis]AUI68053.1 molecular chaperone SurA [Beggiatoa leptomitoformis]